MDSLGIKIIFASKNLKNLNIGLFGGSFDPVHKGHLKISEIAIKKIKLKKVYWVVTKKIHLKKNLSSR